MTAWKQGERGTQFRNWCKYFNGSVFHWNCAHMLCLTHSTSIFTGQQRPCGQKQTDDEGRRPIDCVATAGLPSVAVRPYSGPIRLVKLIKWSVSERIREGLIIKWTVTVYLPLWQVKREREHQRTLFWQVDWLIRWAVVCDLCLIVKKSLQLGLCIQQFLTGCKTLSLCAHNAGPGFTTLKIYNPACLLPPPANAERLYNETFQKKTEKLYIRGGQLHSGRVGVQYSVVVPLLPVNRWVDPGAFEPGKHPTVLDTCRTVGCISALIL